MKVLERVMPREKNTYTSQCTPVNPTNCSHRPPNHWPSTLSIHDCTYTCIHKYTTTVNPWDSNAQHMVAFCLHCQHTYLVMLSTPTIVQKTHKHSTRKHSTRFSVHHACTKGRSREISRLWSRVCPLHSGMLHTECCVFVHLY